MCVHVAANESCARSFYVRVLGFQRQPRPPFPFGGAWLTGGGLTLHLIDDDPTIPHALGDWRVRPLLLCARAMITLFPQGCSCVTLHLIDDDLTIPQALGGWRARPAVLCAVPSLILNP